MVLSVYVDDFKLAGPARNVEKGWKLLASDLELDPPQPLSLYLGCIHERSEVRAKSAPIRVIGGCLEVFGGALRRIIPVGPTADSRFLCESGNPVYARVSSTSSSGSSIA